MKTQISHQGMSYTRSFPELAEITFIAVAEHLDNAFLTLCTRENMQALHRPGDGTGQYTQPKQQ